MRVIECLIRDSTRRFRTFNHFLPASDLASLPRCLKSLDLRRPACVRLLECLTCGCCESGCDSRVEYVKHERIVYLLECFRNTSSCSIFCQARVMWTIFMNIFFSGDAARYHGEISRNVLTVSRCSEVVRKMCLFRSLHPGIGFRRSTRNQF